MYTAGLYFARRFARTLELVKPDVGRQQYRGYPRPFQLDRFRISEKIRETGTLDRLFFSTSETVRRWRSPIARMLGMEVIEERAEYCFQPNAFHEPAGQRAYVSGYWQAAGYAEAVEPVLREILTLHSPASAKSREYANVIESVTNPVSVHLRFGDYAQIFHATADRARVSNVLSFSYYQQAIDDLRRRFEGLTFIVFSDEPKTARALMQDVTPSIFVEGNTTCAYEDLWLISLCRFNIIANSSFSWWGAWLNPRRDKQVYAPRYWFNTRGSYFKDLYPGEWTLIDNVEENSLWVEGQRRWTPAMNI
jgi:hypothetical protein